MSGCGPDGNDGRRGGRRAAGMALMRGAAAALLITRWLVMGGYLG